MMRDLVRDRGARRRSGHFGGHSGRIRLTASSLQFATRPQLRLTASNGAILTASTFGMVDPSVTKGRPAVITPTTGTIPTIRPTRSSVTLQSSQPSRTLPPYHSQSIRPSSSTATIVTTASLQPAIRHDRCNRTRDGGLGGLYRLCRPSRLG